MAGVEVLMHVWRDWGIQALVLLSFMLQVTLLILAEFRRYIDSGVLRFFIWSAYMSADATAIYVLGHMSVTARLPGHELVGFWAPFLLMHLGGQDNITAYAIEDNQLWLRHLQTLAMQVAVVGYVLYESSIFVSPQLAPAAVLTFMVGVYKCGERVWALRCASSSPMGMHYRIFEDSHLTTVLEYINNLRLDLHDTRDTETDLIAAHLMVDFPTDWLKGTVPSETRSLFNPGLSQWVGVKLYKVVEMQLSLMHDVFYTKVAVVHSVLNIRMIMLGTTAVAFWQFHDHRRKHDNGYNKVDVTVTYVLFVGSVVLGTVSLLRPMFSSWTTVFLAKCGCDTGHIIIMELYELLAQILNSLRRLVHATQWRRRCSWSRSMGQHSLLHVCTGEKMSRSTRIARWMRAEDWWNTRAYSWSIPVSASIEKLVVEQVLVSGSHDTFDSIGQAELKRLELYEGLDWSLDERITVWHIATNIYLSWWSHEQQQPASKETALKVEAVEALSNYMMFLLAARPHMLPPAASRNAYVEICYAFTRHFLWYSSAEDLISRLQRNRDTSEATDEWQELGKRITRLYPYTQEHIKLILQRSFDLGAKLISKAEESQDEYTVSCLLAQVWTETLYYTANGCSIYSHVKQLSNGGELITVAALYMQYRRHETVLNDNERERRQIRERSGLFF